METIKRKWGKPVTEVQRFVPNYCQEPCTIPTSWAVWCPSYESNGFDGFQQAGGTNWPEGCETYDHTFNSSEGKWFYLLGNVTKTEVYNGQYLSYYEFRASEGAIAYTSDKVGTVTETKYSYPEVKIYYKLVSTFQGYVQDESMKNHS